MHHAINLCKGCEGNVPLFTDLINRGEEATEPPKSQPQCHFDRKLGGEEKIPDPVGNRNMIN
jgi:hypothetical protein